MVADVLPDPATPFGERVARRLRDETVIWLTTVGGDGCPQPNPVWFLWRGDHLLVYNRPDAHRLVHIRQRPEISLNFDGDGQGGDIIVLRGRAEQVDDQPLPHELPEYLKKYQDRMVRISGSPEAFGAAYPVPVRVDITKVRGF